MIGRFLTRGTHTLSATRKATLIPNHVAVGQIHLGTGTPSSTKPLLELFYFSNGQIAIGIEQTPAQVQFYALKVTHGILGSEALHSRVIRSGVLESSLEWHDYGQQSPDGSKALHFTDDASDGGTRMIVQNVDGTGAQTITDYGNASYVLFTQSNGIVERPSTPLADGGSAPGVAILSGTPLAKIAQIDGTLADYDLAASTLVVVDSQGNGSLVRTSDGQATPFATGLPADYSPDYTFDATTANLYYIAGGALKHVVVASPGTSSTVVPTGVTGIMAISPDGALVLYTDGVAYYVASTSGASSPVKVATPPQPLSTFSGFFTADSTHVLCRLTYQPGDPTTCTLSASPSTGGAATWVGACSAQALVDSRVLVDDNKQNLSIVDAAGKIPTRLLEPTVVDRPRLRGRARAFHPVGHVLRSARRR